MKIKYYRITKSTLNGEVLHTALRKCCDSAWTSVAYNSISSMKSHNWDNYINSLKYKHPHSFYPKDYMQELIKKWSLEWEPYTTDNCTTILKIAFKNFSENDWMGYCSYLKVRKVK